MHEYLDQKKFTNTKYILLSLFSVNTLTLKHTDAQISKSDPKITQKIRFTRHEKNHTCLSQVGHGIAR